MAVLDNYEAGEVLRLTYSAWYKSASGTPTQRRRYAWGRVMAKALQLANDNPILRDLNDNLG